MTSNYLLDEIVNLGIKPEAMGLVPIEHQSDFKEKFKVEPMAELPKGMYLYIRTDEISDDQFGYLENGTDDILWTDEPDTKHDEEDMVVAYMLFHVDDYHEDTNKKHK